MSDVSDGTWNDEPLSMEDAVREFSGSEDEEVREDEAEPEQTDDDQPEPDDTDEEGEAEQDEQADADGEDDYVDDGRKVRLEDGRVVTIAELRKGTLLQADYTRKTQEVAEQRRQAAEERAQYMQQAQQFQQTRELAIRALQASVGQAPDPNLMNTDPIGYMQAEQRYRQGVQHLQALHHQSAQERAQMEAVQSQEKQAYLQQQKEMLVDRVPEFRDPAKLQQFRTDLERHASYYGLSPAQFDDIEHHGVALMARDAIAYRKLQSAKSKTQTSAKVEGRPPVQRSGKRPNANEQQARTKDAAFKRLNQTGSLKDGVKALLASEGL